VVYLTSAIPVSQGFGWRQERKSYAMSRLLSSVEGVVGRELSWIIGMSDLLCDYYFSLW
jgi:hypothetical protein